MRTNLDGKVALITGAARGIGAQTARELAARGVLVSLVGMEPTELKAVASELGEGHTWFEADVTDAESIEAAVAGTVAELGGIDIVIANAGIAPFGSVLSGDPNAFVRTIDVNINGVFRTVRAALPHVVERQGYVLIVSSLSAFAPLAGMAAYTASKAGVEALASSLAGELDHLGVAVGSAHPSWIDTDLVRETAQDLPTYRTMRSMLPWPMHSTTTVEKCGRMFAEGVRRRSRRIYVPRSVMVMHWLRNLPSSKLVHRFMRPTLRRLMPKMDAEVAALGRSFSARNVRLQTRTDSDTAAS